MHPNSKQSLRKAVRQAFPGESCRRAESLQMLRHIMAWPVYQQARVLGGYMPMPHEADGIPLMQAALAQKKVLVLPRCGAMGEMTFRRVTSLTELSPGAYGLLEPSKEAPLVPVEEIDLLLTPLEALSHQGWRLGKGGGYYDRVLPRLGGCSLGLVLSHQWNEEIPRDPWDIPLKAAADFRGVMIFNES